MKNNLDHVVHKVPKLSYLFLNTTAFHLHWKLQYSLLNESVAGFILKSDNLVVFLLSFEKNAKFCQLFSV